MPVVATKRENVLMVRFHAPAQLENQHVKFDVVCYLHLTKAGVLEINYSHHLVKARSASVGPFTPEMKSRMPYDAALQAMVTLGAMQEFWASVVKEFRQLPGELDTPVDQVEL